jgi:hypothetical protein
LLLRCLRDVRAMAGEVDLLPSPTRDDGAADASIVQLQAPDDTTARAQPVATRDIVRDAASKPQP